MSKLMCLLVLMATVLGACAPFPPHRVAYDDLQTQCGPVFEQARPAQRRHEQHLAGGAPAADAADADEPGYRQLFDAPCWRSSHEFTRDYDLFFVEFDDHGWLPGAQGSTIKWLMRRLNALVGKDGGTPLNLVVYTHGWHHTAAAADDNVNAFRDLLERAELVEQQLGRRRSREQRAPPPARRRVVGVYIGWRGDSVLGPGIGQTSIWDRKLAAEEVAQGAAQELFANLHNFYLAHACHFSEASELVLAGEKGRGGGRAGCTDVQMLTIGHSFGALITYRALAGRLMANIAQPPQPNAAHDPAYAHSFGDLVVLINPAFEGVHFEALARAASERSYQSHLSGAAQQGAQLPILIILQSEGDAATRLLFPLFRRFTTLFERAQGAAQADASLNGVGWTDRYLTHRLDLDPGYQPGCTSALPHGCLPYKVEQEQDWRQEQRATAYRGFGAPRLVLSNGLTLTQGGPARPGLNRPPFMPIWVVRTGQAISRDHNDFLNVHLVDFLRQVYYTVLGE